MAAPKFSGPALVCRGKLQEGGWAMEKVQLREPGDHELVVEMVATGICHTDVHIGSMDPSPVSFYPRVLGHEGSGYVRAAGAAVTVAAPGDPVLLSFYSCGRCHCCEGSKPAVCTTFNELNFGPHPAFTAARDGAALGGKFFGQSSFARFSVVDERSVVNARPLLRADSDLKLFAPLGCGIQTGSGTVVNTAAAGPADVLAVFGLGGVGLSAVLAARMRGVPRIVGVDRVASRLRMARELGATHVVDAATLPAGVGLADAVREAAGGLGPSVVIEATGVPELARAGYEAARNAGTIIQVGAAPWDAVLEIPIMANMVAGKTYRGTCEGDAVPAEYIPRMVGWFRDGVFPFDKLVRFYDASDYETALRDMRDGRTVKPVLVWS